MLESGADDIVALAEMISSVHVAPHLRTYIVELAEATRRHHDLALGASPRGALALQRAARAFAATAGRDYTLPDDVKRLAPAVLSHRLLLSAEAEMRGRTPLDVLTEILDAIPVPGATGPV